MCGLKLSIRGLGLGVWVSRFFGDMWVFQGRIRLGIGGSAFIRRIWGVRVSGRDLDLRCGIHAT